jgi:AcrR family transcriptional regulator
MPNTAHNFHSGPRVWTERTELEWVRPPQQARSAATLERLLDAAEQLIEERGVSGMTVSAIVKRARSSVGAFYARFGDKENLLRCLFERFYEQAEATAASALDPERWADMSLRDALGATIAFTASIFLERAEVIAALERTAAEDRTLIGPARALGGTITARLLALAEARGETFAHPDPERAVALCVWMVLSALGNWSHTGADPESPPGDPGTFAAEVTEMTYRYLFQPRG